MHCPTQESQIPTRGFSSSFTPERYGTPMFMFWAEKKTITEQRRMLKTPVVVLGYLKRKFHNCSHPTSHDQDDPHLLNNANDHQRKHWGKRSRVENSIFNNIKFLPNVFDKQWNVARFADLPASGVSSSSGSVRGLSSSGTAPAACCVSVVSLLSLSSSPPYGQSPTRPVAATGSAFSGAPLSWADSNHHHHRRRPHRPRDCRTRSCHHPPRTSASCVSPSDCRRWNSDRNRCDRDLLVRCPPPVSFESRIGIQRRRMKKMSLRRCHPGWRQASLSAAFSMHLLWFSALTRTFSACTNSPCLDAKPEPGDIQHRQGKENRT